MDFMVCNDIAALTRYIHTFAQSKFHKSVLSHCLINASYTIFLHANIIFSDNLPIEILQTFRFTYSNRCLSDLEQNHSAVEADCFQLNENCESKLYTKENIVCFYNERIFNRITSHFHVNHFVNASIHWSFFGFTFGLLLLPTLSKTLQNASLRTCFQWLFCFD